MENLPEKVFVTSGDDINWHLILTDALARFESRATLTRRKWMSDHHFAQRGGIKQLVNGYPYWIPFVALLRDYELPRTSIEVDIEPLITVSILTGCQTGGQSREALLAVDYTPRIRQLRRIYLQVPEGHSFGTGFMLPQQE